MAVSFLLKSENYNKFCVRIAGHNKLSIIENNKEIQWCTCSPNKGMRAAHAECMPSIFNNESVAVHPFY